MWKRTLEEEIEAVRKKMEDTAQHLGLGHPKVYQLSVELDRLHNEWQKQHSMQKKEKTRYPLSKKTNNIERKLFPFSSVV